jgi:hypothetical protein
MSLDGSLEDFGLSDVLQLIHIGKRTGVLMVSSEGKVAEIYFKDGEPIHAVIGDEVGEKAVYKVFNWREGQFRFETKLVSVPETITVGSQNLILEATRRIDEWAKLRRLIPSSKSVLVFSTDPRGGSENITLEPQEWRILSLVDGRRNVEEIAERSGFSELKTTTILYGLVSSGLLSVGEKTKEPEKDDVEDEVKKEASSAFRSFIKNVRGAFGTAEEEKIEKIDEEFKTKIGITLFFINTLLTEIKEPGGLYNPVELKESLSEMVRKLEDKYSVLREAVVEDNKFDVHETEVKTNHLDELSRHEFLMGMAEILDSIYDEMVISSNKSAAMRRFNKVFEQIFTDGRRPEDLGLEGIIEPKVVR